MYTFGVARATLIPVRAAPTLEMDTMTAPSTNCLPYWPEAVFSIKSRPFDQMMDVLSTRSRLSGDMLYLQPTAALTVIWRLTTRYRPFDQLPPPLPEAEFYDKTPPLRPGDGLRPLRHQMQALRLNASPRPFIMELSAKRACTWITYDPCGHELT